MNGNSTTLGCENSKLLLFRDPAVTAGDDVFAVTFYRNVLDSFLVISSL